MSQAGPVKKAIRFVSAQGGMDTVLELSPCTPDEGEEFNMQLNAWGVTDTNFAYAEPTTAKITLPRQIDIKSLTKRINDEFKGQYDVTDSTAKKPPFSPLHTPAHRRGYLPEKPSQLRPKSATSPSSTQVEFDFHLPLPAAPDQKKQQQKLLEELPQVLRNEGYTTISIDVRTIKKPKGETTTDVPVIHFKIGPQLAQETEGELKNFLSEAMYEIRRFCRVRYELHAEPKGERQIKLHEKIREKIAEQFPGKDIRITSGMLVGSNQIPYPGVDIVVGRHLSVTKPVTEEKQQDAIAMIVGNVIEKLQTRWARLDADSSSASTPTMSPSPRRPGSRPTPGP